jgi:hypothetical protein
VLLRLVNKKVSAELAIKPADEEKDFELAKRIDEEINRK